MEQFPTPAFKTACIKVCELTDDVYFSEYARASTDICEEFD